MFGSLQRRRVALHGRCERSQCRSSVGPTQCLGPPSILLGPPSMGLSNEPPHEPPGHSEQPGSSCCADSKMARTLRFAFLAALVGASKLEELEARLQSTIDRVSAVEAENRALRAKLAAAQADAGASMSYEEPAGGQHRRLQASSSRASITYDGTTVAVDAAMQIADRVARRRSRKPYNQTPTTCSTRAVRTRAACSWRRLRRRRFFHGQNSKIGLMVLGTTSSALLSRPGRRRPAASENDKKSPCGCVPVNIRQRVDII